MVASEGGEFLHALHNAVGGGQVFLTRHLELLEGICETSESSGNLQKEEKGNTSVPLQVAGGDGVGVRVEGKVGRGVLNNMLSANAM